MKLTDKVTQVIKTAVSDLFGEEVAETDPLSQHIYQAQTRLNQLRDELAQAVAREKRAEIAWKTAQSQGELVAEELEQRHRTFAQATASLQDEMEHLQHRLTTIRQQAGQVVEREESAVMMERLQQIRKEMQKTADSLHTSLEEREEQIALREDKIAAREEIWREA